MDLNQIFTLCGIVIGAIVSIAGLLAGIGYFLDGRKKSKLDTQTLLQNQINALEKKVNDQDDLITKLTSEVKSLHTAVDEKNKKITEMMEILQGRDPQMQAFVEIMRKYIDGNVPLLEIIKNETVPTIRQLQKYLDSKIV